MIKSRITVHAAATLPQTARNRQSNTSPFGATVPRSAHSEPAIMNATPTALCSAWREATVVAVLSAHSLALPSNTSLVAVGGSGVLATVGSEHGIQLAAGQAETVPISDAHLVFIDVRVANEGVTFTVGS